MAEDEELRKDIQDAIKSGKCILGYRKSIEYIKTQNPSKVVISNNIPEDKFDDITHNAEIGSINVIEFDGSSKDLGVICGKPFPVLVLVIRN